MIAKTCITEYNNTIHDATNFTPKYLMFGDNTSLITNVQREKSNLQQDREKALENSQKYHERNKQYYNKNTNKPRDKKLYHISKLFPKN